MVILIDRDLLILNDLLIFYWGLNNFTDYYSSIIKFSSSVGEFLLLGSLSEGWPEGSIFSSLYG